PRGIFAEPCEARNVIPPCGKPQGFLAKKGERPGAATLIVGVNWLGDSIMTMPAIQAWRRAHPAARLVMLVKPKLKALWTMHPAVDEVWALPPGGRALAAMVRAAHAAEFEMAFVLPHSFRSALVPFFARVPRRIGPPGHGRDWMLTDVVPPLQGAERAHQCFEYMTILGVERAHEAPRLRLTPELTARAKALLGASGITRQSPDRQTPDWIAVMPGAAYGPAKRWPAERFATAGRLLKDRLQCNIVAIGSAEEYALCAIVAREAGPGSLNLAGGTTLPELAAVLGQCRLALTNDSGGMHLATAMGVPVTAVFGITDPERTGPLGSAVRVMQESAHRSRDIRRDSPEARASLLRITPEQVAEAAVELINRRQTADDSIEELN
ncbi:MAG: lipopolysaccharide heptosyltransferase II, partial [Kiritimatiellota bacterium]|nr:lipopolysaccharide heptosyltransferase II [Kiritimatiellota bacterium]